MKSEFAMVEVALQLFMKASRKGALLFFYYIY